MIKTIIHPEATLELAEAIAFYEQRRPGLGGALLDAFESAVASIEAHPQIGAAYGRSGMRRYVMTRFPFLIYYKAIGDIHWIVAVAHASRRPRYWKARLADDPSDAE